MRVLVVFAVVVACVNGSRLTDNQKLIPSFSSDFVIKGHEADPHSAPFIVSLRRKENSTHICGGTIIDKEWIVTAAHCIPNRDPKGMEVVAGLHHQLNVDNRTQRSLVDWGVVHEEYGNGVGPFDIALLRLLTPFKFNKYVKPAVLPDDEEVHSGEAHLYGWGQPKFYAFGGAKALQTVSTDILPYEECKAALPENAPIHETNICTDSLQKSISACNGDSGGPLVKRHEDLINELIGIVSWGYVPCGVRNLPSMYTRVSAHKAWISKTQSDFYFLKKSLK